MDKLTIIDSSSIYYQVAAGAEYFKWSLDETLIVAVSAFENILEATKADYYIACGDKGKNTFRHRLLPDFKADRKFVPLPFIKEMKEHTSKVFNIVSSVDLEADDLIVLYYEYYRNTYDCTLASIDSDIRQHIAKFYNYKKDKKFFEVITDKDASRILWSFALGGSHNGLKGITGCGAKCTEGYFSKFTPAQFHLATINAYINGIDKTKYEVPRNVTGFGLLKGVHEFYKNFVSTYLIRTKEELDYLGIEFEFIKPIKIQKGDDLF